MLSCSPKFCSNQEETLFVGHIFASPPVKPELRAHAQFSQHQARSRWRLQALSGSGLRASCSDCGGPDLITVKTEDFTHRLWRRAGSSECWFQHLLEVSQGGHYFLLLHLSCINCKMLGDNTNYIGSFSKLPLQTLQSEWLQRQKLIFSWLWRLEA